MSHATELIRQIIRKQGLHTIYPGSEDSAFGDLLQTAWVQIERTLYKYRSRPHCRTCFNPERPSDSLLYIPGDAEYGIKTFDEVIWMGRDTKKHIGQVLVKKGKCPNCSTVLESEPPVEPEQGTYGGSDTMLFRGTSKVFNMWSQIARTVILAYIKKEGRDRKNSSTYMTYLDNKPKPESDIVNRFLKEAREICQYNDDHLAILAALEHLIHTDPRPHDGIIGKLVEKSGLSRSVITGFMRLLKLRSFDFTDSPLSRRTDPLRNERRRVVHVDFDDE